MPSRPRRRKPTRGAIEPNPGKRTSQRPPHHPSDPLVGRKLAGYEIAERVRSGPSSVTYKARQPAMGREVAIRVLRQDADQATIETFYRTARHAAQVHHANIAGIYDVGSSGAIHFATLELLEGRSLADLLRSRERLPSADAIRVAIGLAEAFAHVKNKGLKGWRPDPELVILTQRGELKVLPPVLADEDESTLSTDYILRSLGVLLYAMLTGGRVANLDDALAPGSRAAASLPPLRKVALGTRRDVAAMVGRLLGIEGEGFPTVGAAAVALRELLAARERAEERARNATERARERQRRKKRSLMVAAAIGGAVVLVVLALLALQLAASGGVEEEFTTVNASAQQSIELFKQARAAFIKHPSNAAAQAARAHLDEARKLYAVFHQKHPRHHWGSVAARNAARLAETLRQFDDEIRAYTRYSQAMAKIKALDAAFKRQVAALLETGGKLDVGQWVPRYQALLKEFSDSPRSRQYLVRKIQALPRLVQRKQMEIDTNKLCRDFQQKYKPQHLYKQALAAWDAYRARYQNHEFLREEAIKNYETQTALIARDAREQYTRLVNRAQRLAKDGKAAEARRIYQKIINDFGVPSLVEKARGLLAKLPGS